MTFLIPFLIALLFCIVLAWLNYARGNTIKDLFKVCEVREEMIVLQNQIISNYEGIENLLLERVANLDNQIENYKVIVRIKDSQIKDLNKELRGW